MTDSHNKQCDTLSLSPNPLVRFLNKPKEEFTREDIVNFIMHNGIKNVHFRYPGLDGKLKELKLPINNQYELEKILTDGERVDGSSLYPKLIDASLSDMYVVPVYKSAFVNPFYDNTLDLMCRFFDKYGNPMSLTPDNVLANAHSKLKELTGAELYALGELEFYVVYDKHNTLFPGNSQRGYHESMPFVSWSHITSEMTTIMTEICGAVKYCHSEVGFISQMESEFPELDNKSLEQHEIEFLPAPVEDMADYVLLGKWVIRNVAAKHGVQVTFAPKINEGDAGSGLHFHLELRRDNKNVMTNDKNELSEDALKIIGGLAEMSRSLTAFGNTVSSAYLRLVPHQEAPTNVCWSESNRSALIRVPLGWRGLDNLASKINPQQKTKFKQKSGKQTVEFRAPDGSADVYLLLAGLTVAARRGLTNDDSLKIAEKTHVVGNIFHDKEALAKLDSLPTSCHESSEALIKQRELYQSENVFPADLIDFSAKRLVSQGDKDINTDLQDLSNKVRLVKAREIMVRNLHVC